jgi:hypothetical protein
VAADQYQLSRLRRICEKRLCDTVDVETVATTLALAEQNHAEELKKVGAGAAVAAAFHRTWRSLQGHGEPAAR